METMTFEQVRNKPGRLAPILKGGRSVRITKGGKPFFDAVPPGGSGRLQDFFRRIDEVWAGSKADRSTADIVATLRESRQ